MVEFPKNKLEGKFNQGVDEGNYDEVGCNLASFVF